MGCRWPIPVLEVSLIIHSYEVCTPIIDSFCHSPTLFGSPGDPSVMVTSSRSDTTPAPGLASKTTGSFHFLLPIVRGPSHAERRQVATPGHPPSRLDSHPTTSANCHPAREPSRTFQPSRAKESHGAQPAPEGLGENRVGMSLHAAQACSGSSSRQRVPGTHPAVRPRGPSLCSSKALERSA